MLKFRIKICALACILSGLILFAGCAEDPPLHRQIAESEGLTLEEKIQQLVYRGASRTEVLATFGESTGYTNDTLSYTVRTNDLGDNLQAFFHGRYMDYDDPRHPFESFRWVLKFDERGALYDYRRETIDGREFARVYGYWDDEIGMAGSDWHEAYRVGFPAMQCDDPKHCWVVGSGGLVMETTDGGQSWVSDFSWVERPGYVGSALGFIGIEPDLRFPIALFSVAFPDRTNGWATGRRSRYGGGLILHSSDGGLNWKRQDEMFWGPPPLWSTAFVNDRVGWTVGAAGTILHTSDGGTNWTNQVSGTNSFLLSVSFCDEQSGWAVGGPSWTILHTSNAGQSWLAQNIGAVEPLIELPRTFPYPEHVTIYFDYYHGFANFLNSVSVTDCKHVWVAGDHGTICHSEDGGTTWHKQPTGLTDRLNAVQFISNNKGWAVGDRGTILGTTNGGNEWVVQSSGTREDLHALSFVDEHHGWASGTFGTILHTTDGGATWTKQCTIYDCAGEAAERFYWHPWLNPDSSPAS